jgi:hypothetical protein
MNRYRLWTVGAIVAIVAIVGAAIGIGVEPSLAATAAADASTSAARQANVRTLAELSRLAGLGAKQSALVEQNGRLGYAVTGSLRWNTFSRQVRGAAAADGVQITALTSAEAADYVPPTRVGGTTAATPAPSASTTTTPAPATTSAATPGQFGTANALITGSDFVVIPVTVAVTGDQASSFAFVQDLQQMNRLFAVDNVTYSTGSGAAPSTTISGNIYALRG